MSKGPKIALALGGGGARGLAHIGVLKVIERENIPLDLIVGTSMGALVGAAYAIEPDAVALEKRALRFFSPETKERIGLKLLEKLRWHDGEKSDLIHRALRIAQKEVALSLILARKSLLSEKEMQTILRALFPDIDLGDTRIPYGAIAADLVSGREIILDEGPLIRAVMASCAVPGFMPPVAWNDMVLVDGGVVDVLPAGPAKDKGVEIVIGVDVGPGICTPAAISDGFDEIHRVTEIMSFYLSRQYRERVDVLIEPAVKQNEWTDFLKYRELILEGEKATESKIGEIREVLNHRIRRKVFRTIREIVGEAKRRYQGRSLRPSQGLTHW